MRMPQYLLVTLSAWGSRIITALVQLTTIRLLLDGIGTERYAVYLLLASLAVWYNLLDFGLGTSLQNFVGEKRAKSESYAVYVRTVVLLAAPILIVAIGALYIAAPLFAPLFLKQASELSLAEKTQAFFVSGAMFVGITMGSIIYKLWYAEQKGHLSNLLPAIASVLGLAGIWLILNSELEAKLIGCLLAFNLPAAVLSLIAVTRLIIKTKGYSNESSVLLPIIYRAVKFWVFSGMAAVTLQADYLIMSQVLNSNDIVVYSIVTRIFGIGMYFFSAIMTALWSSFTELMANRRWDELTRLLKLYLKLGILGMLGFTGILAFSMPWVLLILAPRNTGLYIPTNFILLVGCYQLIIIWVSVFSTVLQSASLMRVFLVWTPLQMVVSVSSQWWLGQKFGIYGITLGLILSFLVMGVWYLPLTLRRHIREQKKLKLN